MPCSSLWSGIPTLASKQILLPGTDINGLSKSNQIVCFTENTSDTNCVQDANRSNDCMIIEPIVQTPLRNTSVTPTITKDDLLAKTVDSGFSASTTFNCCNSPVLICGVRSSVDSVEETDDEECILETSESPLPGLSSIHHRLSQLADSANALGSQPSTIASCSPVIPNQSASRVLSLVRSREAPLGDKHTASQLLDLTLDEGIEIDDSSDSSDNVVIVKVVEGKGRVKREGGAALVLTNQIPVVTCCGIVLTQADLDTLRRSQWLNDQVQ